MAIEETIKKLLAKAERTDSTAEADAFFAKAEELMLKYGLEFLANERDEPVKELPTTLVIKVTGTYWREQVNLSAAVAAGFSCKVFYSSTYEGNTHTKPNGARITLVGFPSDLEMASALFTSLNLNMALTCRSYVRTAVKTSYSSRHVLTRSFMSGFSSTVHSRLLATKRRVRDAAEPSLLPVLASRESQVQDYMSTFRTRAARSAHRDHDYHAGRAGGDAASRADLGGSALGGGRLGLPRST